MIFIVMGVSGCGKTTVGRLLAEKLNLAFYDADDFHPVENVEKMAQGIPLNDEDRQGWLEQLYYGIQQWEKEGGAVIACSALKERYRKILEPNANIKTTWVFLEGSRELILQRVAARKDHFMPPALLDSQLEALEKPAYGIHLNISSPPEQLVQQTLKNYKK